MESKKGIVLFSCLVMLSLFASNFPLNAIAENQVTEQIELKVLKNEWIIADSYRVGQDSYVTGEVLSTAIKKIEMHVNGKVIRGGIIYADNSYEIEAEDTIRSLEDKVEVVGLDRKGKELSRQIVALEKAEITLSAADYTMFDEEITGVAGNKMDEVSLLIEGEIIDTVKVNGDQTFVISVEPREITSIKDHVEIVGSVAGRELGRIAVTLNPFGLDAELPNYVLGKNQKVTGKLTGKDLTKAQKVRLFVNRKRYTTVDIKPDGTFEIDSAVFITDIKDNVQISVLNEKGNEIGRYQIIVTSEGKTFSEWFPDPHFASLVAETMKKNVEQKVSEEEFLSIVKFEMDNNDTVSLEGIQYLKNLEHLRFFGVEDIDVNNISKISDITQLSNLTNLKYLAMGHNQVSDISALRNLVNLKTLIISSEQVKDFSILSNLTNLEDIHVFNNHLCDLSFLRNLIKLKSLAIYCNQVDDISSLANLQNLEKLTIGPGSLSDISSLNNLTNLKQLELSNNEISDIDSLNNLEKLEQLFLTSNQINDISALKKMINLKKLQIGDNKIEDISALNDMTQLEQLFLYRNQIKNIIPLKRLINLKDLRINNNDIKDISPLNDKEALEILEFGENQVNDISPLGNLHQLSTLSVARNEISNIDSLKNLMNLKSLNLNHNNISDISVLEKMHLLETFSIDRNKVSDLSSLANLVNLRYISIESNQINDISSLANLTLQNFNASNNQIKDITPLSYHRYFIECDISDQNIVFEQQLISNDKRLTISNPIMGLKDNWIFDVDYISNNGVYSKMENLLIWEGLSDAGEVDFKFNLEPEMLAEWWHKFQYSGTVTISYEKR
ncbi:leucine-rich repeat domain-containing protein [Enterococcus caccae]|uniref:Uncharacterized protein n=1 Tax=Enterococcus caccae ATCC BAA-1240 TaxID=1158612 RepID=R3WTK9_9ENTE|nr:leucine-rich repeat domain-containing protein [Enterococcus caccae]EOL45150.1 hypothetical protein UC7_01956 [Enterococcus caccae ATCC BAA-1240]EOT58557.1 hypothetical protein I580_02728 [Enterococcus caccae ATCC BAA-1240]OJG27115.1 hypothetical protein RU98_GL002895 [Enterococcus caccae]